METMLSALSGSESLKIKELAVSAIGAIGNEYAAPIMPSCIPWSSRFGIDVSLVIQRI